MKNSYLFILFLSFFSFGIISCASVFEPKTRAQLHEDQLKMVQYYVSTDIILTRELATGESPSVSSGRVAFVDGKRTEQILISGAFFMKTPGVLVGISRGTLSGSGDWEYFDISFEDDDKLFLRFVRRDDHGDFQLVARGTWPETRYGDLRYTISYKGNKTPYLLGRVNVKYKETKDIRRVKGRRIN